MKAFQATGRALRVLVTHPSSDLYGSDRVLLESVSALLSTETQVLVTLPVDGPLADELRRRGAGVILCPTLVLRKSLLRIGAAPELARDAVRGLWNGWRLITWLRPDVVYVSTLTVPLWTFLGWCIRRPVVCHVHEAESAVARPIRAMLNAPLILTSSVLANSEYSANVLAGSFPSLRRRTTVIYNAVIGPRTKVPARQDIEEALRVLFVGRVSPRKGVDVLVEAIATLRLNGVDARLDIVGAVVPGSEAYQAQLERSIARHDLQEAVTFHGFDPDIWPHLAGADIAVVPSRSDEPFGNTAVEAILAARPLVVSDTSGLREAAAGYESAVFVEPGNPLQLADALERIRDAWHAYRMAAVTDAESALKRNSTENYRNGLISAVTGAGKRSAFLG